MSDNSTIDNIHNLRISYKKAKLKIDDLAYNPIEQFKPLCNFFAVFCTKIAITINPIFPMIFPMIFAAEGRVETD